MMYFDMSLCGKIKHLSSREIVKSIYGVGLEKLDREMYDPVPAYDKLAACGLKFARIQSGWARTEKGKGVYDFSWLDEIVDNLLSRGIEPWMCLCYGNPLYTETAKDHFCGVGCPPVNSEEELNAWINYCTATVSHYSGRVRKYEIWNEPDGDWCWVNGQDPVAYGNFALATAKAIKNLFPDVYMIGGATAFIKPDWLEAMFSTGVGAYLDAISYHRYTAHLEDGVLALLPTFYKKMKQYGVKDLIQGESGCQSAPFGNGALWEGAWDEEKQVKMILRRDLIDLISGVALASYFSAVDVDEALIGISGAAYFGLLKTTLDENGQYTEKPGYFAKQNICTLFAGAQAADGDVVYMPDWSLHYYREDESGDDLIASYINKDGAVAFCYYKPTDLMTTTFESTVSMTLKNVKGTPVLVDPRDGSIYRFTEKTFRREGNDAIFTHVPVKDYPLVIAFDGFVRETGYGKEN